MPFVNAIIFLFIGAVIYFYFVNLHWIVNSIGTKWFEWRWMKALKKSKNLPSLNQGVNVDETRTNRGYVPNVARAFHSSQFFSITCGCILEVNIFGLGSIVFIYRNTVDPEILRKTIPMRLLRKKFRTKNNVDHSHKNAHGPKTFHLSNLRQSLHFTG